MVNSLSHVVITGASGGIGAALAIAYAAPSVRLSLLGRKREALEKLATQCKQKGAEAFIYCVDIQETEQLQQTITEIDAQQPVDLMIANAGVANYLDASCDEEKWQDIKTLLDVNLNGAIATITPLVTLMRKRKRGQIALISSLAAYRGMAISPSYCASKAGLKAYGESLRALLSKEGVKVNIVCPGFVESKMSNVFPGDKIFLMSADKAAGIIKTGLLRNKACIAFPRLLHIGLKILTILPAFLSNFILQLMSYGVVRKQA